MQWSTEMVRDSKTTKKASQLTRQWNDLFQQSAWRDR